MFDFILFRFYVYFIKSYTPTAGVEPAHPEGSGLAIRCNNQRKVALQFPSPSLWKSSDTKSKISRKNLKVFSNEM